MKTIDCWRDLEPFGIDPLTGEACSLMFRLLLDVDERGRKVLAKLFGVPGLKLAEPWNRGTKEQPHVGSIMLTHDMLTPVSVFALLENGYDEVYLCKGSVVGFDVTDSHERRQRYAAHYELGRRFSYGGGTGRNVHQMSGRLE